MSLTEHIAAQRTEFGVPHAVTCRALGVAESSFYERRGRPPPATRRRRDGLDAAVRACFEASGGTYGSPRVRAQLRRDGLAVSKKSVEASMARQGRTRRRRLGLTRADKAADPVPDLLRRDFTADGPDQKWVGDSKQVDTVEGPVFLASVEDLYSRSAVVGYPCPAVRADPACEFQQLRVVSPQVASMDRLVVRDPVPEEVEALLPVFHVGSDLPRAARRWVEPERARQCGHPHRCQVEGLAQVAPESEAQLCDDLAVRLRGRA